MDNTTRTLLVALGVLLIVALGFSALMGGVMGPGIAGQGPVGPAMMRGHGWMWGLGMGLGGGGPLSHSVPLDVLKRRYAAGEVTREQYEQMRKDIER